MVLVSLTVMVARGALIGFAARADGRALFPGSVRKAMRADVGESKGDRVAKLLNDYRRVRQIRTLCALH
jgi:hypothetical protein